MLLYIDIETDGFNPTKIWVAGVAEDGKVAYPIYSKEELQPLVDRADGVVAHNGIKFDFPVIERLWGVTVPFDKQIDSYVLSCLANPSRAGGHGLAAWGASLGYEKGDHDDWSCLSPEMIRYCLRDVEVMRKVMAALQPELKDFTNECCELEHRVAGIMAQQERVGFLLDSDKASNLYVDCSRRMLELEQDLQVLFPTIVEERWSEKTGKRLKDKVTPFNVGSRKQIGERLMSVGWKPKRFTEKGQAIVDETILSELDLPGAAEIAEYLTMQKRVGQISQWMDAVEPDGRVRGRVRTIGAVTGRMTHSGPNMAQIPSMSAVLGRECRDCWTVPDDSLLVGIDASGLELRMLAHYMKDEQYTEHLLEGDIHSYNQQMAGLETRAQAKTFIYAFLYGAGNAKIGKIVGGNAKDGEQLRERFLTGLPKLRKLIRDVQHIASNRKTLPGLDGRRIHVRSEHAALNTLLQGAGAVVMKQWLIGFDQLIRTGKYPAEFVANVHDEVQVEVMADYALEVAQLGVDHFPTVSEQMGLRCPLAGEYAIGKTWAETH